jgi:hypothetical protein
LEFETPAFFGGRFINRDDLRAKRLMPYAFLVLSREAASWERGRLARWTTQLPK